MTWKISRARHRQPEVWRAPIHTRWLVAGAILIAIVAFELIRLS